MEFFSFGERLMIYRKRAKLSKKALAESLGISVATLSKYENDKIEPDLDTISGISAVLNISMNKLMAGFDDPNKDSYKNGLLNKNS